jgi:hypothetical protein
VTLDCPSLFQVCSTLSFSGSGVFHRMNRGFDVVVIDEAAQAVSNILLRAHPIFFPIDSSEEEKYSIL